MGQKRSKNQIRRERQKLRKLEATQGDNAEKKDHKADGSAGIIQKEPETDGKPSKSDALMESENSHGKEIDQIPPKGEIEYTKGKVTSEDPETQQSPRAPALNDTASTNADVKDKSEIEENPKENSNIPESSNGPDSEKSATNKKISPPDSEDKEVPGKAPQETTTTTEEEAEIEDLDAESKKKKLLDIFSRLEDTPASERAQPHLEEQSKEQTQTERQRPEKRNENNENELFAQYSNVFNRFQPERETTNRTSHQLVAYSSQNRSSDDSSSDVSDSEENEGIGSSQNQLSKRQKRIRDKVPISVLKASTNKPQAVEWYDADAPDPFMAVYLKTALNVIDVPPHWSQKKEYLSSKRGVERAMFELPKFIESTGIAEMRHHDPESLKKSQRDRVQPKMGRLDIDYQKLHDAFFKFQTKPRVLAYGEVYSEGREKADHYRESVARMRPGKISKALRLAVGMSESDSVAPPWITVMQDVGKPPSYQDLIIPGLDTEYTNSGYRIDSGENGALRKLSADTWGNLEDGEESEQESDSSGSEEGEDEDENEIEEDEEEEKTNGFLSSSNPLNSQKRETVSVSEDASHLKSVSDSDRHQPERVEIAEYSKIKTAPSSESRKYTGKESLYKVLKEKPRDSDGLSGKLQGYELEDGEKTDAREEKHERKHTNAHDEQEEFRF